MKTFRFYTVLLVLIPAFSMAQSNYKAGYVVTPKGDTIKGFINYKEWEYNPSRIEFKSSINAPAKTAYSLENAIAFAITDRENYRRFTLPVSQDLVEYSSLSQDIDSTTATTTAFFKIVASGKMLLYIYIQIR